MLILNLLSMSLIVLNDVWFVLPVRYGELGRSLAQALESSLP